MPGQRYAYNVTTIYPFKIIGEIPLSDRSKRKSKIKYRPCQPHSSAFGDKL